MFGNPKGEIIHCRACKRFHDIRRGTFAVCACGEIIKSKNYSNKKMQEYVSKVKE